MLPFIHMLFSLKKTSKTLWSCLLSWSFLGWGFFSSDHQQTCGVGHFALSLQISRAGPKHHLLLFIPSGAVSITLWCWSCLWAARRSLLLFPSGAPRERGAFHHDLLSPAVVTKRGCLQGCDFPHLPLAPLDFAALPCCSSLVSMASAASGVPSHKALLMAVMLFRQESLLQSGL